ncbi:hypothetical protein PENSTE_c001G07586 [Penicillium steckii]|uniref:G-patch domain-containing protein n=1 Tax=Penicillium steckii TaxID=303698 RepID=A0A1V6U097_9EURO|nr:hypothetical protein PENSTE_c001G07586 [Penicillium steckii]
MSHFQDDDEDYFIPAEDQRVFGAGIRRKRVPFVRSSHDLNTTISSQTPSTSSGPSIADAYLSIVLKKDKANTSSSSTPSGQDSSSRTTPSPPPPPTSIKVSPQPPSTQTTDHCEICNLPLSSDTSAENTNTSQEKPHEASLAHQVCLAHSHPPSHLDRTHVGLRYLSTYGWDPDSRLGLGAPGREGIREPIKGRIKNDTAGLGTGLDADGDPIKHVPAPPKKVQKLNAKQMRRKHFEDKKKADKLRDLFFMNDDVLKYLGKE